MASDDGDGIFMWIFLGVFVAAMIVMGVFVWGIIQLVQWITAQ